MRVTLIVLSTLGVAAPAAAQDWSGPYWGGVISYDSFEVNDQSYGDGPVDMDDPGLGIFGGYNGQSGNLVFGGELLFAKHYGEGDDGDFLRPASVDNSISVRGRLGYVTGTVLPYVALGATRTEWEADHEGDGLSADTGEDDAVGTTLALGVDWTLQDTSFVRVEVEHTDYGDDEIDFYGGDIHDYDMDATRFSVGYAMHF